MSSHYSSSYRYTLSSQESDEGQFRKRLVVAESAASRAQVDISAIQSQMSENRLRVESLHSEIIDLSDEVSDQRQQIYRVDGEITQLSYQQKADQELIRCNLAMIEDLEQDLQFLESDITANSREIHQARLFSELLKQETDLAHQRISENEDHIQSLQGGMQQIVDYLEQDHQWQIAERQAKYDDINAQRQLAGGLQAALDPHRAHFFGGYSEYLSAITILDQAESNIQMGNLEAAIAQYQQGQAILLKVARDIDARERAFEDRRAQARAMIDQLETEISLLEAQKIRTWYPGEFAQLTGHYQAIRTDFDSRSYEQAGEPVEVRGALEKLTDRAILAYQDIRQLESRMLDTLVLHQERRARLRDILDVLQRVWSRTFEFQISFLNEADPKSTLKFQSQRVGLPNVTVYLDLDKTLQFTWTGYEGMQCMPDIEQFEQMMAKEQHIQLELSGPRQELPSKPNPPFDGSDGTVIVDIPEQREGQKENKVKR